MRAPVESLYRRLLSGFSTVTTRPRYYCFHAWWLSSYANDNPTDSRDDYDDRARRAEALYALASLYNPDHPTESSGEVGISGRDYAISTLSWDKDVIDFQRATDRNTDPKDRYIRRKGGDFSQVYAPQMREIGLLATHSSRKFVVPTEQGRALADVFAASIGAAGPAFLSAAKSGRVDRDTLRQISVMRPSGLKDAPEEAAALLDLLMGRTIPRPDHIARRDTLRLILQEATRETDRKLDQERLRWHWMETDPDPGSPLFETHASWRHFQAGDTARLVCELLLRTALEYLTDQPAGYRLPELAAIVASPASDAETLGGYLARLDTENGNSSLEDIQARVLDSTPSLDDILAPLARLWRIWGADPTPLLADYKPLPERQTVATLLQWIEAENDRPAAEAIAAFCSQFVLRRHLTIASRKLRDGRYTYLFEFEDGRLLFRESLWVSGSGPRLATALRFMDDAGLLQGGQLTDIGRAEMEAA